MSKKIAVLTHFGSFQSGYALHVGWLARAELLLYFGQDFDFLVNESCPEGLFPNQKSILPNINVRKENGKFSQKVFDKKVRELRVFYRKHLKKYDIILTADLLYQIRHNFLVCNKALREVNQDFIVNNDVKKWFHWIHSRYTTSKTKWKYPESLRSKELPDNFTMVYMNNSDLDGVRDMYQTDNVVCVYNPKDFRSFHNFDPLSWKITVDMDLQNKEIVQLLPLCTTRMDAKGINVAIKTFGELKRKGKKVALIIANSNASKRLFELQFKMDWAFQRHGLVHGEDILFTSTINDNYPLPRECVADLFKVSNLFVFASQAEVCPNVLLEAKINNCLLAVSSNLSCGYEFAGEDTIYFEGAPAKLKGIPDNDPQHALSTKDEIDYDALAKEIIKRVPSLEKIWEFSFEKIWTKQFQPLLMEKKNEKKNNKENN